MNRHYFKPLLRHLSLAFAIVLGCLVVARAQSQTIVNLSMLDGIDITPANVFNYQVVNNSGGARDATITGEVRLKNYGTRCAYTYHTKLQAGNNILSKNNASDVTWSFSNNALRELFFNYSKLPQGTYEYCVTVTLKYLNAEKPDNEPVTDCIYQTVNDLFLINLVDPENDAKIYELYPLLTWVVNYPFASDLTYRIRVAELKKGQNNANAIARNNPVFQDNSVSATSIVYPVTAKPLQKFQPYVWTVDAYYKGLLLGGAEVWKFTIIEDTLLKEVPADQAYYEFVSHIGENTLNVVGELKLKYHSDGNNDTLSVKLKDEKGNEISLPNKLVPLKNGNNWFIIPLYEKVNLQHNRKYAITLVNRSGRSFTIPFLYYNPLLIKNDTH